MQRSTVAIIVLMLFTEPVFKLNNLHFAFLIPFHIYHRSFFLNAFLLFLLHSANINSDDFKLLLDRQTNLMPIRIN